VGRGGIHHVNDWTFNLEELFMTAQHTPMEIKAARALCDRAADACGIDRNDNWNVYAEDFKADAKAMLDACGALDLLKALTDLLAVASVRIDDPRIVQFDAARAAIAKATRSKT
jgi:predicted dienelactone hydrolase